VTNNEDIIEDYLHPDLYYEQTNRNMQFDIFVPQLNLAFEYQGPSHFAHHNYKMFVPSRTRTQVLDVEKEKLCKERGIKLLKIPYWITPNDFVSLLKGDLK